MGPTALHPEYPTAGIDQSYEKRLVTFACKRFPATGARQSAQNICSVADSPRINRQTLRALITSKAASPGKRCS